mmetsp:Transcript_13033/g.21286  ORF Transcript_13033/g.21286 Transcript_13033/m.21286 type:complete len:253 (-) Transcript_13033:144-902(-)
MPPPRVMKVLGVVVTATATVALLLLFKQMKSGVEETKQKHKTKEKKKSKMKKNALQLWAAAAHPATDLKVFVGTQSKLKLEAVRTAFSDLNRTVSVVGFKAKSRVSEQPYGHEETRRGAMNRLSHAKSLAKEQKAGDTDFYVAIENGIVAVSDGESKNNDEFYDVAWIVANMPSRNRTVKVQSVGIEVPVRFINEAKRQQGGFQQHTVGTFIAKELKCNPKDPHRALLGSVMGRKELLVQAIRAAIGRLVAD